MGAMISPHGRPRTLAQVAQRASSGEPFDLLVREFLDVFYGGAGDLRAEILIPRPMNVAPLKDAYLGAVCEHLSLRFGLPVPYWTYEDCRFLAGPHFVGGFENLKAILLVESPLAFRRRGIFVTSDALSRPSDVCAIDQDTDVEIGRGIAFA